MVSTKSIKQNFIAFTDASVAVDGEASGAVMLVNVNSMRFDSVHLFHFGYKKGQTANRPEMDCKLAALHLAPIGTLRHVFSDSKGTVKRLCNYIQGGSQRNIEKHLDDEHINFLHEGLERQPGVEFQFMSRRAPMMRLADRFSRFARYHEALYVERRPDDRLLMHEQEWYLVKALGQAKYDYRDYTSN